MKKVLKYILIFISYFLYNYFIRDVLYLFNIDYYNLPITPRIIISIVIELVYLLILIFIYRKELIEELKDFKKNGLKYIVKNFVFYLISILLMIIINTLLANISDQGLSGNEIQVREYIQKFPLYMVFSAVLYAPFVEELIFRKTVGKVFKNKYVYVILSGIIFGLLHISNILDPIEYLFSIPYMIIGSAFAYMYYKTGNIFTTITYHLGHNLILLIIQLL